ncbi:MAG TPA: PAS domain-containing protein [Methylotenera sp.]|nr:PAS domain-containing protein [Methylotenera sp.]
MIDTDSKVMHLPFYFKDKPLTDLLPLFQMLFDASLDNVAIHSAFDEPVYLNPALFKTLNLPSSLAKYKEIYDDEVNFLSYKDAIKTVLRTGESKEFLLVDLQPKFGRVIYDLIYISVIKDSEGQIIGVLATGRDLDFFEQKKNQEIKKQEHYLRALLDSFPFMVWMKDKESRFLACNNVLAKMAGVASVHDLEGKTDYDYFAEQAAGYIEDDQEILNTGIPKMVIEPISRNDGEVHWVETYKSPVTINGEMIGTVGYARDISEQIELHKKVAKKDMEYKVLAENTPDMIVRYDRDFRRVFVNQAYIRNTGFLLEQVINKSLDGVWSANNMSSDAYKARLQLVMETGDSDRVLLEWIDTNEKMLSLDTHLVAERDAQGQVVGVLAFGRNISVLKEAERNLDHSRSLILEWAAVRERTLEAERKRIAREIHDELGQLLTHLRLKIQLLPLQLSTIEQLPENIIEVIEVVDASIKVVRNFASSLRPAVLDSGFVPALEWLADEFSRHTGIACKLYANQQDAPMEEHIIIELFRITQESLTNVTRHSEGTEVTIKLKKELTPPQFVLEIQDNGKGFNPKAKNTKNSLGLMGMHERVRMLSGELTIFSAIEQGTLLRISVPNKEVTEAV